MKGGNPTQHLPKYLENLLPLIIFPGCSVADHMTFLCLLGQLPLSPKGPWRGQAVPLPPWTKLLLHKLCFLPDPAGGHLLQKHHIFYPKKEKQRLLAE